MGEIKQVLPVKLFIAITYKNSADYSKTRQILLDKFGEIDQAYNYNFSEFTQYYQKEMGSHLQKTIVSFDTLIQKEEAHLLKHYSNDLEMKFVEHSENSMTRNVNIDPGYLTEAKVVLLTTKNYSHRVYIGKGIFAEITLSYRKESFMANSWTYPDYKSEQVIHFFNGVRDIFREQLSKQKTNNNK